MRPVPPPPDEIDFALLDRFLAGECSPAEAELARRWLANNDASARYLRAVRDALPPQASRSAAPNDVDALWGRLARETVDAERNAERVAPPLRLTTHTAADRRGLRRVLAMPWVRIAAVVALVVGAATMPFVRTMTRGLSRPIAIAPARVREYAAARGERAELRLPDGTRVVLAPDSRLEVPADFAVYDRSVALVGQAYFEVKHNGRKPFQVRAGNAVARDLGTRFDVRAYPEDEPVQVVVAEGKVQLAPASAATKGGPVLGAGDVGRLDAAGVVTTGHADLATALAWTRGELKFDNTPLHDVATALSRWYDLDVRVSDPILRQKRLILTLGAESASEAIEAVALLAGAGYEQRGRTVTFVPNSSRREIGQ